MGRVALPGAIVQMLVATARGAAMAMAWGWPFGAALVLGSSLSVASTVVLLKALEARGMLEGGDGRIAIGWLVVEDLAMVLMLVLLPPLAALLGAVVPAGLIQAHIARARMLVIAVPETIEVRQMVTVARTLNPAIEVALRSHNAEEAALLEAEQAGRVFVGESELAEAMVRHVEATMRGGPVRPGA